VKTKTALSVAVTCEEVVDADGNNIIFLRGSRCRQRATSVKVCVGNQQESSYQNQKCKVTHADVVKLLVASITITDFVLKRKNGGSIEWAMDI